MRGCISLVRPYYYPNWIVGGFHQTAWIFNQGVVHHPDCWASDIGIFIFRRCIVQHLWYLIAILSATSSQDNLGIQCSFCASASTGVPCALAWRFLGVPFPVSLILLLWRLRSSWEFLLGVFTYLFSALGCHITWSYLERSLDLKAACTDQGVFRNC